MAKSTASELVRGAGMAADVWTRLDQEVKAIGGISEDLHLLARDEGKSLCKMIAGLLVEAGIVARNLYPVTVTGEHGEDYSKLFTSLLAKGDYGYKNPNITPINFPRECIGDFDATLFHPNRDMSSDDVVKDLDQRGLRPATMLELLAFGVKYPEIQREFPIVALGQCWVDPNDGRCVGVLGDWSDGRKVHLVRWAPDWPPRFRFLAVRKSKPLVT